ncbi:MAG: hypothetical protein PHX08_09210 [Lachnospiraceae bacterium]|nr:hypothetical protein [Lachnospiraceae bacterium]
MSTDIRIKGEKIDIKLLNHAEILAHYLKETSIKTKDASAERIKCCTDFHSL